VIARAALRILRRSLRRPSEAAYPANDESPARPRAGEHAGLFINLRTGAHPRRLPPRRIESRDLDDLRTRLVLSGAPPSALTVDDPASIEQLASPDAPGLTALDRTLETREAERARLADRLGLCDLVVGLAEEEVQQASVSGGALSVRPVDRSECFHLLHLLRFLRPGLPDRPFWPLKSRRAIGFSDGPVALVLCGSPRWKPPEYRACASTCQR